MQEVPPEEFGTCPFVTAQHLLQGKWSILILHYLSTGTMRFSELQKCMPRLTHSTLSSQLKLLEKEGLVHREAYAEVPVRVEYSLTDMGRAFQPVLDSLENWGNSYIKHLEGTRKPPANVPPNAPSAASSPRAAKGAQKAADRTHEKELA